MSRQVNGRFSEESSRAEPLRNDLCLDRFLVIGLGSIGRRHLRNLNRLGIKNVCLVRSGQSTLSDHELSDFPSLSSLEEAISQYRPDAVVISNPTSHHMLSARKAAEAGCHILLEKPVSDQLKGTDELVHQVQNRQVRVLVGFHFRFNPGLRILKESIEKGTIGRIFHVEVHWGEYLPDWHPWEDYRNSYAARKDLGGGVVLTLCHPFDYLRWIFGEIDSVTAMIGNCGNLGIEVEDLADIQLRFSNGLLGTVHLNFLQRPPIHYLKVFGEYGSLYWNAADSELRLFVDQEEILVYQPPSEFERNTMFLDEMKHFLDCIHGLAEPVVSLEDGIAALRIALGARQSSEDRCRIRIPGDLRREFST